MIHIIYHNKDLDGFASGALLAMYCEHFRRNYKLHGRDYGDELNINLEVDDEVYMTDFTFDEETMVMLRDKHNLILFDHHPKGVELGQKHSLYGVQLIGMSATLIVYEWLKSKGLHFPVTTDSLIDYIDRYDVFRESDGSFFKNDVIPMQYALRVALPDPATNISIWAKTLFNYDFDQETFLKNRGHYIKLYVKNVQLPRRASYYIMKTFFYSKIFVTIPAINSDEPDIDALQYIPNHKGAVCFYFFNGVDYVYSFRKTKDSDVPILELCKANGGGGHECACGYKKETQY